EQAGQAEQGLQRWGRVRVGVAVADEDATLGGADSQEGVFVFALDREASERDGGVSGEDTGALLERDDELGLVGSANLDEIAVVVPVEIVEETTVGARLAGLRGRRECGLDGAELGELRTAVHELVEDEVLWKTEHDGWRRAERGGKHEVRGAVAVVGEGDGLLEVAVPEPSARSRLAQVDAEHDVAATEGGERHGAQGGRRPLLGLVLELARAAGRVADVLEHKNARLERAAVSDERVSRGELLGRGPVDAEGGDRFERERVDRVAEIVASDLDQALLSVR